MKDAQEFATKVFIGASALFGVIGVVTFLSGPPDNEPPVWLIKSLMSCGFVVLSSFGVSVGLKYLSDK